MSRLGIISIDNIEYDLDDLTLDEMEEIETIAGASFSEINYASAKGLKAFTFVLVKRGQPEVTMEDIGRIKVATFLEPEEAMPELPPSDRGDQEIQSQDDQPRDDSGPQLSAVSTSG